MCRQISGLLGLAGCGAIGAYFWRGAAGQHAWLVLAGALVTVLSYGAGTAPVTFTYLVELLPNSTRALTINMVLLYFSLVQFCAIHFFPAMEEGLGNHGTFWLFAAVNLLQVLLATFIMPETRGLSLEEIQHRFFTARRRSSAGDRADQGIVQGAEQGDVEGGQVNAAVQLDDGNPERQRKGSDPRRAAERRRSSQLTAERRRSSTNSELDVVFPAGCFV